MPVGIESSRAAEGALALDLPDTEVEKARAIIEKWDKVVSRDSTAGAIYVRWTTTDAARQRETGRVTGAKGRALVEQGLRQAIDRITKDWGGDWSANVGARVLYKLIGAAAMGGSPAAER